MTVGEVAHNIFPFVLFVCSVGCDKPAGYVIGIFEHAASVMGIHTDLCKMDTGVIQATEEQPDRQKTCPALMILIS